MSIDSRSSDQPLRVLESFPTPRPTTNPYVVMLLNSLRERTGLEVTTFSWRAALTGRYDVFHVHWPEILVSGRSPARTWIRRAATAALIARLAVAGTPVVRTIHNVSPHEPLPRSGTLMLAMLDRITTLRVLLNPLPSAQGPTRLIPLGHSRTWFAGRDHSEPVSGRIAFVGLIRVYKRVDQLIDAFVGLTDPGATLHVVGSPANAALEQELVARAAGDDRVTFHFDYVDDAEFVHQVTAADVVVLPVQDMYNSSSAIAVLSLNRPVLIPDNDVTRRLADEVGHDWVHRFPGVLGPEDITRAMSSGPPRGAPDLSGRDWATAGELHERAYREAAAMRRRTWRSRVLTRRATTARG